ncbi:MAG TPA: hypothetical protein PLS49_05020 [Candidatus Woesebacteria bacterium]|nr:hypothetical protein [Candidatus Woesebacteria bacterium]
MKQSTWMLLFLAGIGVLGIYSGIPMDMYKKYTLESFYGKLATAEANQDYEASYSFYSPETKRDLSYDDYVRRLGKNSKYSQMEFKVNSIKVIGNRGIVDRTISYCSENCDGENRQEVRARKEYIFINWNWYAFLDNLVLCERDEPYVMPEEFNRAVSLIIQRLDNSTFAPEFDGEHASALKKMRNCINIQYASSTDDMSGAEGLFYFQEGVQDDNLYILVSPQYSLKDDLVTALLLRHELHHAVLHATGEEQTLSCMENEAQAFALQIGFYDTINQEEANSLASRLNSTPEITDFFTTRNAILSYPEKYSYDKALRYVQASEYYQDQCASEST